MGSGQIAVVVLVIYKAMEQSPMMAAHIWRKHLSDRIKAQKSRLALTNAVRIEIVKAQDRVAVNIDVLEMVLKPCVGSSFTFLLSLDLDKEVSPKTMVFYIFNLNYLNLLSKAYVFS